MYRAEPSKPFARLVLIWFTFHSTREEFTRLINAQLESARARLARDLTYRATLKAHRMWVGFIVINWRLCTLLQRCRMKGWDWTGSYDWVWSRSRSRPDRVCASLIRTTRRLKNAAPRRGAVQDFELLNGAVRCGSGQEFHGAPRCAAKSTVTFKYAFRCTHTLLFES